MKNIDVINAFLRGRLLQSGHLSSDGKKLYSYWTCIAQWNRDIFDEDYIIINRTRYSTTTSHHRSALEREAAKKGYSVKYVNNVPKNEQQLNNGYTKYTDI